jgi:murein L,D-transpeptidase YcbB/YkuD
MLARRAVLGGGAGLLACAAGGSALAQSSQANWMDTIFGQPGLGPRGGAPRSRSREPEVLQDLRRGELPLRHEAMQEAMVRAIANYQQIASAGGWSRIPGTRMMRPGDDDERMPLVRRRLAATGELPRSQPSDSYAFDSDTERAVRAFQRRHGLRVSGRVDQPTIVAMNVSAAARLEQLRVNQRRLAELLYEAPEERYVLVNVPAFQLEAVERDRVDLRHRVIVGKPDRQSPSVKATIRAVNFFPYWRVPESVATLDLVPRLLKEPDYLVKENIRVLVGSFVGEEIDASLIDWATADMTKIRFRQDPGERNALGLLRIDMPNEHGVYMHDTPMKQLFGQRGRAFSAGCVRVQDVFQLAQWILRYEPGWETRRVEDAIAAREALDVTLWRQVPVYFTYITAWAEPDGSIEFRPDVYGRDGERELVAGREHDPEDAPLPRQTLTP